MRCPHSLASGTTGVRSLASKKSKPAKAQTKAERRAETTEQMLDAAEMLFSRRGFHGVALKDVSTEIGVHHTLVNYYFGDKQTLFDEVFARRAIEANRVRMEALEKYDEEAGENVTVEGALRAFLDTNLDLYEGGPGWRHAGTMAALVASTPEWGAEMFDKWFDPVVLRLTGLLERAMPECDRAEIFWGFHFVSGALMLTLARTGRIDKLSDGLCKSDDFEAIKDRLARFMAAGFYEICRPQHS
ncbi:MAG: TetR family transcriptional regulator [Alphaproteobacteria bacterium]|nr:TetR family transcriptional regulator [Alphaproteobacteria bacterium]MBU1606407.1 TetR family transcriptional regulator [Alphaproteobacteria bacterium]